MEISAIGSSSFIPQTDFEHRKSPSSAKNQELTTVGDWKNMEMSVTTNSQRLKPSPDKLTQMEAAAQYQLGKVNQIIMMGVLYQTSDYILRPEDGAKFFDFTGNEFPERFRMGDIVYSNGQVKEFVSLADFMAGQDKSRISADGFIPFNRPC